MSGRKYTTVTIGADELARLRRQAAEAASISESTQAMRQLLEADGRIMQDQQQRMQDMRTRISSLTSQYEQTFAAATRERQLLHCQLQETIQDTNQALQHMADQTTARLQEISDQNRRDLQQGLAAAHNETVNLISDQAERTAHVLQALDADLTRQIGTVNGRVDAVERNLEHTAAEVGALLTSNNALLELAREYEETAENLAEAIEQRFDLAVLLPGRLARVQRTIASARSEIDATGRMPTNAPVARHKAREATEAALQLQEDAIRAENAWQAALTSADEALSIAGAQIDACAHMTCKDDEGVTPVDADYWTNGDLGRLRDRLAGLKEQVEHARENRLNAQDLEGLRDAAAQICTEVDECSQFALVAFLASQDRANFAQDIADTMREQLQLEVVSYGYQGKDRRAGFRIHLKNPVTGFEMVVTQYPVSLDGQIANRLESDILDYGTENEAAGDDIARRALQSLGEYSVCVNSIETVPGFEGRASDRGDQLDMEAWTQQTAVVPQRNATPAGRPAGGAPAARQARA